MRMGGVDLDAQDFITKKTGEDIKAKVTEVGRTEVKYKKYDNLDGPVYTIPVSEILVIRYENGTNDVFNVSSAPAPTSASVSAGRSFQAVDTTPDIVPGMRYKDYKNYYRARDYVPAPGDPCSPVLGGVLSWLIPGVGQMVNGELGRGFGYLGGTFACYAVFGVGYSLALEGSTVGAIMTLAGAAALLGVEIAAIVDGVKMAKIKNMYYQDLRRTASVDVKLSPYFAAVNTGTTASQPVAGLALRVSF